MRHIVLYGPPLAGKRTIAKIIAEYMKVKIEVFQMFDATQEILLARGIKFCLKKDSIQYNFMTFPGSIWDESVWISFIEKALSIIIVLDPQQTRLEADREFIEKLRRFPIVPKKGLVVFTKQDLVPTTEILHPRSILEGTPFFNWLVFHTRYDQPETIINLMESIIEL